MLHMQLAGAGVFVLLFGITSPSQTQESSPSLRQVIIHQVKPDMVADFEDLIKNEQNRLLQGGGIQWRQLWRTEVFGDVFRYMTILPLPLNRLARHDRPTPRESAPGIRLLSKLRKCVSATDRFVGFYRPDLSLEPPASPRMALVLSVSVIPGKTEAFEAFIKSQILRAMKKVGGCTVTQTVLGGDTNEWTILAFVNNFGELDQGNPLVRVPGKEQATELLGKLNGIASHTRLYTARYMTELSYSLMQVEK